MNSESCVSGKPLGSLDMCHHPGVGQILTIIDPASPLAGACGREVGGAKLIGGTLNALSSF